MDIHHHDGVDHYFFPINGEILHVAETGPWEAPPLVMLPGWDGSPWRELAEGQRVICPAWDGRPKEKLADDLLALLDALALDQVNLMGHGWGAWIGLLLCLRHPERVKSLLAINLARNVPQLHSDFLLREFGPLLREGTLTTRVEIEVVPGVVAEDSEAVTRHALRFFRQTARRRAA